MHHLRTTVILICLIFVGVLNASEENGTLIITYQTDSKGERLNRIRFWLRKEESSKQILYPKGKAYVNDPVDMSRKVVIDNLEPGEYTIEFLVPNTDRYFREVSLRKVTINSGEVIKVDQRIKPYLAVSEKIVEPQKEQLPVMKAVVQEQVPDEKGQGKLIVSFDIEGDSINSKQIRIRLVDNEGKSTEYPRKGIDTEVPLKKGKIVMIQNVPEGDYTIEFFSEEKTLEKQTFHLDSNKTKSIQQKVSLRDPL